MKHINEYLLSKSKNKIVDDFRQFETKEEACEFLENKGFEKNEFSGYGKMLDKFEKSNTSLFYIAKDTNHGNWWIRFGKGGKNDIFFWRIPEIKTEKAINYEVCDYKDKTIYNYDDFEEFKKYTIKYFNW